MLKSKNQNSQVSYIGRVILASIMGVWAWIRKRPWEKILNVASTVVMAVATVVMALIASNTKDMQTAVTNLSMLAGEAEKQRKENHDALITDQRAWVKVETEITSDLIIEHSNGAVKSAFVQIKMNFINTGKTPALRVVTSSDSAMSWGADISAQQNTICPKNASLTKSMFSGVAIFPGQTQSFFLVANAPPRALEVFNSRPVQGRAIFNELQLFGCVYYRDVFTSKWHQTRFDFVVAMKGRGAIDYRRSKVPAKELEVYNGMGFDDGFYAD